MKGAVAFLYKPFADDTLFAAIRVALSQTSSEQDEGQLVLV